ncbi:hypothetical protein PP836_004710 [Salmonella enterica]|nr:hypothetical protein [Salmonella enterica subsp. diarizonae]EGV3636099.1 hypothetical protein [Salmonella enterica]EKL0444606.1 hypothetical protein [Salmonella enterica]HCM1889877.1 hypothetical protein [Salmonella enterica subsp. diarizonae serovar 57:c:z]
MRLTSRKKEILSYYREHLDYATRQISAPPFDVSGVAYLLDGGQGGDGATKYQLESTRRTLEAMVRDGLLERVSVKEVRDGLYCDTTATVIRYGLPGTGAVLRDEDGEDNAIDGECVRID